jgi:D-alanyl-D-alanine carboxypeptidase
MSKFIPFCRTASFRLSLIVLLGGTACSSPVNDSTASLTSDVSISERIFDALEPHVEASMKRNRTPGIALALTDRNGLVGTRTWGYADLKTKTPVTEQTLFQIGSISKSFTALALLQAQEDGVIDINEPVSSYLPWFEVKSRFEQIRVRHLLTHTAGIPANRDDIFSSPYMAVALSEQETGWPPGSRFHYSNVGYNVLTALLLSVTGSTYEEIIQERFFDPLSMNASEPTIRLESRSRQAIGYVPPYDDRPMHHSRTLVEAPFHEYRIGDGSIQSTAGDLASYVRMWLNHGAGPSGPIVSKKSFSDFESIRPGTTVELSEEGDSENIIRGYGFGVAVLKKDGAEYLRHSGGMVGHVAYAGANMTNGYGVTVLMNGPGTPGALGNLALEIWRAAEMGEVLPDPQDSQEIDNAAEYAGVFRSESGSSIELNAADGTLSVVRGNEEIPLEQRGTDTFYTPSAGFDRYLLVFGRDAGGTVVEVSHGADWYKADNFSGPVTFDVPDAWSAFVGRYRNYSPWFSYFEVLINKGDLFIVAGEGGESSSGGTRLVPLRPNSFQVGEEVTPERVQFFDIVDGRATRVSWSGHQFFRQ